MYELIFKHVKTEDLINRKSGIGCVKLANLEVHLVIFCFKISIAIYKLSSTLFIFQTQLINDEMIIWASNII